MPIDPTLLHALELELTYAKQVSAGGQPPNDGRIKAIEAQIALCKKELKKSEREHAVADDADRAEKADADKPKQFATGGVVKKETTSE